MGFKIQRRTHDGELLRKKNISEDKVRRVLSDDVIQEMKLGRYEGKENIRKFAVYTYVKGDPLFKGDL